MNEDNVLKEFNKPEFMTIASELELEVVGKTAKQIIKAINDDLDANGIPEEDDCSQLLEDYLYVAGFIGDDGKGEPEGEIDGPLRKHFLEDWPPEPTPVVLEDIKLPDCYKCADERDPACKRCRVFDSCMAERILIRERELPCFGKLFDINHEECSHCLEAGPCKIALRDVKVV